MRSLLLALLISISAVAFGQAPDRLRSDNKYTQVDTYLRALKTLSIPFGPTPTFDGGNERPGSLFYDTTENKLKYWDGAEWVVVGADVGQGAASNFIITSATTLDWQNGFAIDEFGQPTTQTWAERYGNSIYLLRLYNDGGVWRDESNQVIITMSGSDIQTVQFHSVIGQSRISITGKGSGAPIGIFTNRGDWVAGTYSRGDYVTAPARGDPAAVSLYFLIGTEEYNSTTSPTTDTANWSEVPAVGGFQTLSQPSIGQIAISDGNTINLNTVNTSGNQTGIAGDKGWSGVHTFSSLSGVGDALAGLNDSGQLTRVAIPEQANADWDATSGVAEILNKPTIGDGTLTLSTGTGLTGSSSFTANQAGAATFTVEAASGYAIPTTAKQTEWDIAYSWGNPKQYGLGSLTYNHGWNYGSDLSALAAGDALATSFIGTNIPTPTGAPTGFNYPFGIHLNPSTAIRGDIVMSHTENRLAIRSGGRAFTEVWTTDNLRSNSENDSRYFYKNGGTISNNSIAPGWPNNISESPDKWNNKSTVLWQIANNAIGLFGDNTSNQRRWGFQVGHASPSFTNTGILELNPFGGLVRINGADAAIIGTGYNRVRTNEGLDARYLQPYTVQAVLTADKTLSGADKNAYIRVTGSRTITMPADLSTTDYPIGSTTNVRVSTGATVNFAGASGVTLDHPDGAGNVSVEGRKVVSIVRVGANAYDLIY